MTTLYSVWAGGSEINDYPLYYETALRIAEECREDGYDDIQIERIYTKENKQCENCDTGNTATHTVITLNGETQICEACHND